MVKPDLGRKCRCARCGRRFYDLGKSPPACPFCDAIFDAEQLWHHRQDRQPIDPGYPEDSGESLDEDSAVVDDLSRELLEAEDGGDALNVPGADSSLDPTERGADSDPEDHQSG